MQLAYMPLRSLVAPTIDITKLNGHLVELLTYFEFVDNRVAIDATVATDLDVGWQLAWRHHPSLLLRQS